MVIATTSQANLQCNRRMKELPPGRTESPQKHGVHWKVVHLGISQTNVNWITAWSRMTFTLLKTVWTAIRPGWSRKNFTEKVGIRPELMEGDGGVCLSNGKEKVDCRELLWAAAGKVFPGGGGTEADAEDLCLSASCLFALFSKESSSSMLNPHSSSILSLTH